MKWSLTRVRQDDWASVQELLEDGWEPFAVVYNHNEGETMIYFRLQRRKG